MRLRPHRFGDLSRRLASESVGKEIRRWSFRVLEQTCWYSNPCITYVVTILRVSLLNVFLFIFTSAGPKTYVFGFILQKEQVRVMCIKDRVGKLLNTPTSVEGA